ncbi:MAG: hypothetical protein IPM53_14145 [Anaerolineaceae bacterium]|nr:hypothetical protein [Anaerolineaceae bacterium]
MTVSPNLLDQTWKILRRLSNQERLLLAKMLLDSVVESEIDEELDWQKLSLSSFNADWDNPEDAIYDNWRELYGVSEG